MWVAGGACQYEGLWRSGCFAHKLPEVGRMRTSTVISCSAIVMLGVACGRVGKPKGSTAVPGSDGGSAGDGSTSHGGESGEPGDGSGGTVSGTGSSRGGSSGTVGSSMAGRAGGTGAGTSAGGASSGASSVAGAPTAGAGSITPPDGCALTTTHVSDTYCSADMACNDDRVIVSCAVNPDGGWRCDCQNGDERNVFQFPDATGTRTCDVAGIACLHPELLTGDGPCLGMTKSDTVSCAVLESCVQDHHIDGVELTTQTQWSAQCGVVTTDLSKCACGDTGGSTKLIKTTDFTNGCEFLYPLCKSEATPLGDWSCEPNFEESGAGYGCHSGSKCERPVELADGSPLVEMEQYNLNCRTVDGRTRCACEGVSGYEKVTLLVPVSADDIDACRITTGVCAETEPFEPAGAEDCRRSNETATPTDCTLAIDCTQSGTTGSTQVTSLTHVNVGCIHRDNGTWFCSCNEGFFGEQSTLSLEADSSAEACEQSIADCPVTTPGLNL